MPHGVTPHYTCYILCCTGPVCNGVTLLLARIALRMRVATPPVCCDVIANTSEMPTCIQIDRLVITREYVLRPNKNENQNVLMFTISVLISDYNSNPRLSEDH
jgi:hypothetical protein